MNMHSPPAGQGAEPKRRRPPKTPKGRQVDPNALEEIRALLGERPRRRDLLIEHLHLIQDEHGHLSAPHLTALAHEMKLALAEVYEVATFYAHFDVVKEGEAPPPALTLRVCDSLSCAMAGAERLLAELPGKLGANVRVLRAPCMGACERAPVCAIGHAQIFKADAASVTAAVAADAHAHAVTPGKNFEQYRADGGYQLLKACLDGQRTREDVIKAVADADLRGMGGAGFPTGRKWNLVRAEPAPRLFAVNADEGEPGTFKDRHYLGLDPHRFIEGMLIAAWVVEAAETYLYIRDEYPELRLMLLDEIAKVEKAGLSPHTQNPSAPRRRRLHLRRRIRDDRIDRRQARAAAPSSALRRASRIVRSPNARTECRDALLGARHYRKGRGLVHLAWPPGRKGLRSFSVSGRVKDPGVKLAPAGITARELIDEFCGGMARATSSRAICPAAPPAAYCPPAWPTSRSISARSSRMAALSARTRSSFCPTRTTPKPWRSISCAFSRTNPAANARPAASARRRPSS